MTKDEFYEKYGEALVTLDSYYKFQFEFKGTLPDGKVVCVSLGGNADDIYREKIQAGVDNKVSWIEPNSGTVYNGNIIVDSFDERGEYLE